MLPRVAAIVACAAATVGVVVVVADDGDSPTRAQQRPLDAEARAWKTWVIDSPAAIPRPRPRDSGALTRERPAVQPKEKRRWLAYPAVERWLHLAMEYVAAREKNPPASSRAYALLAVSMYDAAVAAAYWQAKAAESSASAASDADPVSPSGRAAIAGVASRVLAYLFPERSALQLDAMATEAARETVALQAEDPAEAAAGLQLGREVAKHVIHWGKTDGSRREWRGRPPRGRGSWRPPPGSIARPVEPLAGEWRTWVLKSGDEFRPPPPPRFGGRRFVAEAREVVKIGADLTPRQRRAAVFWAGGEGTPLPAGIWIDVVLEYLADKPRMSEPRAARVMALVAVAMADAGVAAWDAKYAYWSPRPENAIRDLGIARRWKPLLDTPLFPAYPSGHATYSAAAAEVLAYLFPEDAEEWRARGGEAALSRVWGGIHYRSDGTVGAAMGRKIGRRVIEHARRDGADS